MNDLEELLQQAESALAEGNRLVARGYWMRATRLAPDRLDIWLKRLQVTDAPEQRKLCLENIVRLDPFRAEERAELALLQQKEQAEQEPVTSRGAVSSPQPAATTRAPAAIRPDVTDEMRLKWDQAVASGETLYCINHPQRETTLRCNSCGAPICVRCARRTPVGFRCKACIDAQQSVFYNSRWYDYLVAGVVSLIMSVVAAGMVAWGGRGGWAGWWFAGIVSPIAGGIIGGAVHWAIGRRRGRWIWLVVAACIVVGALAMLVMMPSSFIALIIYCVLATGAAVGVLRLGKAR